MASYRYLVFLILFVVTSCAQVGTITGGGPDVSAPKPVEKDVMPLNGSTNFDGNHVEMPFDEFFTIKNASENIVMIPPHARINASFKGKKLLLDWEDTLQENTTYAIYLNRAIQDLTESNDSIIQYVFSTGAILDTLSYTVQVKDAWSNKPIEKATVILYDLQTSELKSFASTNSKGFAEMKYLRAGEYSIAIFKDLNSDMEYQDHEPIAFSTEDQITLLENKVDSVPYRLYTPVLEPKITTKKFVGPNSYFIAANRSLRNTSFTINKEEIKASELIHHTNDSVQLFWNTGGVSKAEVIVQNDFFHDTISLRYSEKTTNAPLILNSKIISNTYAPSDTVAFVLNDLITAVDTSLVEIQNLTDSLPFNSYSYSIDKNTLYFHFDKQELTRMSFEFKPNAIRSLRDSLGTEEYIITLNPERKYGVIDLNLSYYQTPIILQTIKDGKLIKETPIPSPSASYKLNELIPGQYTFIIINDENGDGTWNVGNYSTRTQPETLDVFSTPTKVRANWEVVVELIPSE